MATQTGPESEPPTVTDDSLSGVDPLSPEPPPESQEAPAALTLSAPRLGRQLRGMFFDRTFREDSAARSDEDVLGLAVPLYADESFRRVVAGFNGEFGEAGLDLNIFRDALDERAVPPPSADELPEQLRLVASALALPPALLVRNPLYILTERDVAWARANPNEEAAWGVASNRNFTPTDEDLRACRAEPHTRFAQGVGDNPNFTPEAADLDRARSDRNGSACCVMANPNVVPSDADLAFARANPNSAFTRAVLINRHFVPTDDDILFARANPETDFGELVMTKPTYAPTSEDILFARANPNSSRGRAVAGNVNFEPTREDVELAHADPNTGFAARLAGNPNFVPTAEDFGRINPHTAFAWALAQNGAVFLRVTRSVPA